MRSLASDVRLDASADWPPIVPAASLTTRVVRTVLGMASAELHRLGHQPAALVTRAAQPLLWILVFGAALSGVRGLQDTAVPYQTFVVPGVLGQSVVMVALHSGLGIIWERDLGMTQRILAAPSPRFAVVLGKAFGASVRVLVQVTIVLAVVSLFGLRVRLSPLVLVPVVLVTISGALLFASLSLVIASLVRSRDQFQGLGQLIMLPLFFASNALYSVDLMPGWLQVVATVNPLTYLVEALRYLLLGVGPSRVLFDVSMLLVGTAVLVSIAARTYPKKAL